jgi:hypothetical protein
MRREERREERGKKEEIRTKRGKLREKGEGGKREWCGE